MASKRWQALQRLRSRRATGGTGLEKRSHHLSLRWYESWIIRAAALTAFILFCGYASSIIIAIQGIDSVSSITYDEDIEQALGKYMNNIKEVHKLQKDKLVIRLRQEIPKEALVSSKPTPPGSIRAWLEASDVSDFGGIEACVIKQLSPEELGKLEDEGLEWIDWVDQETLKIFDYQVSFPRSTKYQDFQAAQQLRQRYQFIGATLEDEIKPTLILANSIVLAATFAIMIAAFLVLARRFKTAVEKVIDGFSFWSEQDSTFRFSKRWSGELRLITAQFNAMADEVETNRRRRLYLEKVESWQTIARKIAHEIKNPLTPIQMMVSQLGRRYQGDDEKFRDLLKNAQEIVTEEVNGLRRMVDSFSDFARLPMPQVKMGDLVGPLRRAADLQQAAFPHHKIHFESEIEHLEMEFDADLIRQVIINLVKNAAEASGDNPATIVVRLHETPEDATISVNDNGPGIPEDMQRSVFEAYFTTKHSGPSPGMGLGLAVCQKIIMDHQGELQLTSQPGDTTFNITLPKARKDTAS